MGREAITEEAIKELTSAAGAGATGELDKVLMTIIALWVLKETFEEQEDEWQMIARKAKNFLKSQGITKLEPLYKKIS